MRKVLGMILMIALATGVVSSAGGAPYAEVCLRSNLVAPLPCPPKLEFDLGASILPRKLPKHEMAPAGLQLEGTVSHDDESHPPALREAIMDVDKDLALNVNAVPACRQSGRLDIRVVRNNACRDSIIGKGHAHVAITFAAEPVPASLTLFNGGIDGHRRVIYIRALLNVPVPTELITTVKISRNGKGLHAVAEIPVIAGGSGSILGFRFTIRRGVIKAKEKSYLEANCPDSVFKITVPKLLFKNEANTPGVTPATQLKGALAVPCTPAQLEMRRGDKRGDDP